MKCTTHLSYLLLNKLFPDYYALTLLQLAIPINILACTHIIHSCIEENELLFSTDSNSNVMINAYLQRKVMTFFFLNTQTDALLSKFILL
jgi:hypothetical protein